MTTTLIITTYNRPKHLKRCFASVLAMSEMPSSIIIMDDASTDPDTIELINNFEAPCYVVKCRKAKNAGIKDSLMTAFNLAFYTSDIAINLDGDAIVRKDLISVLLSLKKKFPDRIVSGFNCDHPQNPILNTGVGYVERKHCNGINMCLNEKQFNTIIRPALIKVGNWDFNSTNKSNFIISTPSLVQHIAPDDSSMGHEGGDVACDFMQLRLPTVTLFGIDANDPKGIRKAAEISQREVEFGDVKIITERHFWGREGYSEFCIRKMAEHIDTEHALIIHADGYILNPLAWKDEWLKYDYIGAWWHFYTDGHSNGNGGFSLRSKKFLLAISELADKGIIKSFHPEDQVICRDFRKILEKQYGIKYAPKEVCLEFSIERFGAPTNKYEGQFGFHGGDLRFDSLPQNQRPYHTPTRSTPKYSALEMWKNRPKPQATKVIVHPKTRNHGQAK